jgi:hypothetical protein
MAPLPAQAARRACRREQLLTQAAPGTVEAHLGRGLADAELTGDLLVCEVVHVPQHNHHPHLIRKIRQSLDETLAIVGRPGCSLRIALGARLWNLDVLVELDVGAAAALCDESGRTVHRDAVQPCPEPRVTPELPKLAEGAQVSLLQHITRVVLVADQSQCQGVAVGRRGANQMLEGRPVPVLGLLDDEGEVVGLAGQRVSLWTVCCRSNWQYFFISIRSRSFCLFFMVM